MNKQNKGNGGRGIEWCDYTFNPIAGCMHGCQWEMPDGEIANCYAEDVADGLAQMAYPKGFESHYFKPQLLDQPMRQRTPARIFVGSMADVFGHWVPDAQIQAVLDVCRKASWHTFQFLTKNAPRLTQFDYPPNVWLGVSAPPTFFMGKRLTDHQQVKMLIRQQDALRIVKKQNPAITTWMSIEPLSFNIGAEMDYRCLDWAVIGAASNGKAIYHPNPVWFRGLVDDLVYMGIPVFYKGNLKGFPDAENNWREEFPGGFHVHP